MKQYEGSDPEATLHLSGRTPEAEVFSWKTIGRENWLDRGTSLSDVLGLVVLPPGLSDSLEMPDDPSEDESH